MLRIIRAFLLGAREFRLAWTMRMRTHSERRAYDWGREWAHRVTLRRFDR